MYGGGLLITENRWLCGFWKRFKLLTVLSFPCYFRVAPSSFEFHCELIQRWNIVKDRILLILEMPRLEKRPLLKAASISFTSSKLCQHRWQQLVGPSIWCIWVFVFTFNFRFWHVDIVNARKLATRWFLFKTSSKLAWTDCREVLSDDLSPHFRMFQFMRRHNWAMRIDRIDMNGDILLSVEFFPNDFYRWRRSMLRLISIIMQCNLVMLQGLLRVLSSILAY